MMSRLTQARDEAARLHTCYMLHRDSKDEDMRRKAHLDLDRYLMENRELAIMCIEQVLDAEIDKLRAAAKPAPKPKPAGRFRRLFRLKGAY